MWLLLLACGGNPPPTPNAYDRDADGFFSFVDCDDENAGVYPGAPEVYYDGRDANCDGADDYDQDGDGYAWDVHGGQDCDDTDPLVNPDATEVPYDGADNDCDPSTLEDDLDQDGAVRGIDCDDADPERAPGAIEKMGDGIDQDCRNDGDSAVLESWYELITRPRGLRATTFEGRPVFAFAADRVDAPDADATTFYDPEPVDPEVEPILQAVRVIIDPMADEPEGLVAFGSENDELREADIPSAVDLVGSDDALWVGVGYTTWRSEDLRTRLTPFVRFNGELFRQNGPSRALDGATGAIAQVDVRLTDEGAQMSAGGDDTVTVLRGAVGDVGGGLGGTASVEALGGTAVTPDDELWSCDAAGDCTRWSLPDDGPPTDPEPLEGVSRVFRERNGLLLVQDDAFGVVVEGLPLGAFPPDVVLDADVVELERRDGSAWVAAAALVEGGAADRVALAYGPVDAGVLNTVFLDPPADDAGFPFEVAVWADENEVIVAAITQDFARYDRLWIRSFPWAD